MVLPSTQEAGRGLGGRGSRVPSLLCTQLHAPASGLSGQHPAGPETVGEGRLLARGPQPQNMLGLQEVGSGPEPTLVLGGAARGTRLTRPPRLCPGVRCRSRQRGSVWEAEPLADFGGHYQQQEAQTQASELSACGPEATASQGAAIVNGQSCPVAPDSPQPGRGAGQQAAGQAPREGRKPAPGWAGGWCAGQGGQQTCPAWWFQQNLRATSPSSWGVSPAPISGLGEKSPERHSVALKESGRPGP